MGSRSAYLGTGTGGVRSSHGSSVGASGAGPSDSGTSSGTGAGQAAGSSGANATHAAGPAVPGGSETVGDGPAGGTGGPGTSDGPAAGGGVPIRDRDGAAGIGPAAGGHGSRHASEAGRLGGTGAYGGAGDLGAVRERIVGGPWGRPGGVPWEPFRSPGTVPGGGHVLDDLRKLLPTSPAAQRELLRDAVNWLIEHVDQPQVLAARCADLGPVVAQLGVSPQRLDVLGILLVDLLRANPPGVPVRRDQEEAWTTTGRLAARWLADGAAAAAQEPAQWSAPVVEHDRRRADLAVIRVRTYLPYPCEPGQLAVIESARLPERWRDCWVGNVPSADNVVELHVALYRGDPVGAELVERTAAGDRVRLRPAVGVPAYDPESQRPLLVVVGRDAVAPAQSVLAALRSAGDDRAVTVFWPAPTDRDLFRLVDRATEGTVVVQDRFSAGDDDWAGHDAFVAGTSALVADVLPRMQAAGIAAERTRVVSLG